MGRSALDYSCLRNRHPRLLARELLLMTRRLSLALLPGVTCNLPLAVLRQTAAASWLEGGRERPGRWWACRACWHSEPGRTCDLDQPRRRRGLSTADYEPAILFLYVSHFSSLCQKRGRSQDVLGRRSSVQSAESRTLLSTARLLDRHTKSLGHRPAPSLLPPPTPRMLQQGGKIRRIKSAGPGRAGAPP